MKMKPALEELNNMIGLDNIKKQLLDQILYFSQPLHRNDTNLMHTIIQGSPGVGKTKLGKILGKIYCALNITSRDTIKIVKRSDLIGQYLGQTAVKTQQAIDDAMGGVLFIDEAYSLGDNIGKTNNTYSKECLDTINQNLSENKSKFICIIAGYAKELNNSFSHQIQD